jgi:hypothetical protein
MDFKKDEGLKFPIRPCNQQPIDGEIDGFPSNSTCKCNSCDKSCNFDTNTTLPILEGFSLLTVAIVYLFVIIATLLIYACKCYYRRKHPHFNSRSSSFDSQLVDNNLGNNSNNDVTQSRGSENNINNVRTD